MSKYGESSRNLERSTGRRREQLGHEQVRNPLHAGGRRSVPRGRSDGESGDARGMCAQMSKYGEFAGNLRKSDVLDVSKYGASRDGNLLHDEGGRGVPGAFRWRDAACPAGIPTMRASDG